MKPIQTEVMVKIDVKIDAINDAINNAIPDAMIYEKTNALTDAKIFELAVSTSEKRYLVPSFIAGTSLQRSSLVKFLSENANNCGGKSNE